MYNPTGANFASRFTKIGTPRIPSWHDILVLSQVEPSTDARSCLSLLMEEFLQNLWVKAKELRKIVR